MPAPTLYQWKACVLVENDAGDTYGLWTYVMAEDVDAAAENAETLTGGEIVMLECVDPAYRHGQTLAQRIAA